MQEWLWQLALVALVVVFVVVVVAAVVGLVRSSKDREAPPATWIPGRPIVVPGEALQRIRAQLAAGKKIQAIKDLRLAAAVSGTGLGLKEAKDIVDAMAAGRPVPLVTREGDEGGGLAGRARTLRAAGDFPAAVALVQAETGMSQTEAERFVAVLSE